MQTVKKYVKAISRGAAVGFAIGAAIEFVHRERNIKRLAGLYEQAVLDKYKMSDELSDRTSQLWAADIEIESLRKKLSALKEEHEDTILSYNTLLDSYRADLQAMKQEGGNNEC